ncbi:alpha/beta fold hydrolase [Deinococcus koreensis]|uniref:Alpha/beta hydrolase n=1 Tax=Deinococcus koreensis TaxID=2054903 RepID=A0A2K3UX89_9DEIO|nr:alpha/beta fold hydrolase [Deinococcus koreensis]PNY81149.1 alpha/beta hydrolase [Deinococcus koreensis]
MKNFAHLTAIASAALLLASCNQQKPVDDPLKPFTGQTLNWVACDPTVLGIPAEARVGGDEQTPLTLQDIYNDLGDRLKCADVKVPLDWANPGRGTATMSVIRTAAATPAKRQGIIAFNPGGPGGDGLIFAPLYGYAWGKADQKNAIGRNLKAMADGYDLIGFSPRGVGNSTRLYCGTNELVDPLRPPASDRSEKNIQTMIRFGQLSAKACQKNPVTPFINTDATVRDLDLMRQLLGEQKLNYIGYSYGTWLGSWYAKRFPQNSGKMLLDGNTDFSSNFEETFKLQPRAFERDFRDVVAPYLSRINTAVFGESPMTAQQIYAREQALGEPLRFIVGYEIAGSMYSRERLPNIGIMLRAATVLDDLIKAQPTLTLFELFEAVQTKTYFKDPTLNDLARQMAINLVFIRDSVLNAPPQPVTLGESSATFTAVTCNDTPWNTDQNYWRQLDESEAKKYPLIGGSSLANSCLYWQGGATVQRPALPATMPPVLMVQNEFDPATATEGALNAFNATPSARLLFVEDEPQHTAFPYDTECVDLPITNYFLSGTLTSERRISCPAKPLPFEDKVYPVTLSSQSLPGGQRCLSAAPLGSQAIRDPKALAAAQAARQIIVDSARSTWGARLDLRLPRDIQQKLAQQALPTTCP